MRLHSARSRDRRHVRPYTTETKRTCRDTPSCTRPQSMHVKNYNQPLSQQPNVLGEQMRCERVTIGITTAADDEANRKNKINKFPNKTCPNKLSYSGVSSVTIRTAEPQRRWSKSPCHLRRRLHQKPVVATCKPSGGKPADHTSDANSRKLYTQSAKAKTEQMLSRTVKKLDMSEKDLILTENNSSKITDSMFDIYQRYLANCKPHHKRLSIMQAHEIIHREHTFQAKYGKKQENATREQEGETTSSDKKTINSAQVARREKKPQYSVRTMNFPKNTTDKDETRLMAHAAQCSWFKSDVLDSGVLNKDNDTKINAQEQRSSEKPVHETDKKEQRIAQENSLRRQKQKELIEEVEREHSRIERELQDNERVKLIEQYLDDVYSRYSSSGRTLTLDTSTKLGTTTKVPPNRKSNIYSWLPKKHQHGTFGPGMASVPASILQKESSGTGCQDKKIDFKEKSSLQTKNDYNATKLRFFNEWSRKSFSNYVNSEGEFLMNEADQDFSSQFKDPSYWMKQHLNTVALKTNSK